MNLIHLKIQLKKILLIRKTINHKRIEKAKIYLKDTDYKVYEVADILGFENVTYFSRFFKKHTGISPKEYKESWH